MNSVRDVLKTIRAAAPAGMHIDELFDQSVFVKQAIEGVLREGAIAAGLTALMILLFLGSWRSTLVVMTSIPLAILSSLVVLYFLGETINTMTLGGLALAVGILVDNSTVTIENTHRLLNEEGQPLPQATLHGAAGIAVPTLVSTLAISCVFTSVIFLDGPAKYLFTPLGLAVVFAMLASYGLSRTLTPIMIGLLTKGEHHGPAADGPRGWFARFHRAFEAGFERLRAGYVELLTVLLARRFVIPLAAVLVLALGSTLYFFVGRDFFPLIDGGQIQLHVRAPAGTRIEATERIFQAVEDKIRDVIPEKDRRLIVDNIGLPARSYNLAFSDGSTIGVNDGVILVALNDGHAPTADYVRKLREVLPAAFPDTVFYFQAADIVTQILNFGLPAQIDVRTVGYDRATNLRVAKELRRRIAAIPGVVDAHLQQEVDGPAFYANIDRTRAAQLGLNAVTVANNLNVTLSSSEQVTPNFWTDPASGIPYYIAVQTPERDVNSLNDLNNTPVSTALSGGDGPVPGLLSNVATVKRSSVPTNANQANIQPVYEVYASLQDRDLGSVAKHIDQVVAELQQGAEAGQHDPGGRPDRQHEQLLRQSRHRAPVRRRLRLLAHGGELPEFRRPVRRAARPAGDLLRHRHHAVHHRHDAERAVPDGRHHGGGRRLGEFDPARHLRPRAAACRQDRPAGRDRCRADPHTAGADDGGGDDRRHDPDGDRRGGRGAERRPGARRHRRPAVRHPDDACWSCLGCSPSCGRAMTASRRTVYSRRSWHERHRTR